MLATLLPGLGRSLGMRLAGAGDALLVALAHGGAQLHHREDAERHEEAAAFAACAYAKFTGRLGVCLATSGPGGIHLLNGIYDAKLDNQPVLAINRKLGYRPEVGLLKLVKEPA